MELADLLFRFRLHTLDLVASSRLRLHHLIELQIPSPSRPSCACMTAGYWVECATCEGGWQVPYYSSAG